MNRYLGLRQLAHPKLYKSVAVGDVLIQKNNVTSTWSEGFGVHEDLMPAVEDSDGLCRGLKPLRCSALFSYFFATGAVSCMFRIRWPSSTEGFRNATVRFGLMW